MKLSHRFLSVLGALALPIAGQAHYLWIESDNPADVRVYFGEFNEDVREKAGGRLDERETLQARIERAGQPASPLPVTKKEDHFAAAPQEGEGWIVLSDTESPVMDWTKSDIGIVKPMFYARAAIAGKVTAAQPSLTLDILPDPANPNQFTVYFKQQPLPKAKVLVAAPNLWSRELQADEHGKVTISTPWPGRYVLDIIHKERTPGEFKGQPYEAVRHRVTFSRLY